MQAGKFTTSETSCRAIARLAPASRCRAARREADVQDSRSSWLVASAAAALMCMASAPDAMAARAKIQPPTDDPDRCLIEAFDKFADTRANFSQEASGGMDEAFVDVRGCNFANLDLRSKVFSGVLMRGADFHGSNFVGVQFARVDAKSADLSDTDFTDVNAYGSIFDGANLENAQFENAILTGATFGKDRETGEWANLKNTHFEGALLASSDILRICENPTLEATTKKYELGCKAVNPSLR